jgi:uncharacterized protein YdaU (DUF1376 family)
MHYYKRNLGDYAKKAGRLSMLQHGAYTLLIDACYDREQFPTIEEAIEWTWASTTEEIEAVTFVLRKFFTLENGIYIQNRIKEEIDEYHGKSEKNRQIALDREAKRKEKNTKRDEDSTKREQGVNESPPNHKPITNNQSNSFVLSVADDQCPHQKIIDLYHERLPMLTRVKVWNAKRQNQLRTRWKEEPKRQSLDYWARLFDYIAESDLLTGRAGSWKADLEWITKSENFVKIIEGKYTNRAAANG